MARKQNYARQQGDSQQSFYNAIEVFRAILQRSSTVTEEDKRLVEEYLQVHVYDSSVNVNHSIRQNVAEDEVHMLQQRALDAIEKRYPSLISLAQEKVLPIKKAELLQLLVSQINKAPDESLTRWLLSTF